MIYNDNIIAKSLLLALRFELSRFFLKGKNQQYRCTMVCSAKTLLQHKSYNFGGKMTSPVALKFSQFSFIMEVEIDFYLRGFMIYFWKTKGLKLTYMYDTKYQCCTFPLI